MRPLTLATLVCLISVPLSAADAQESKDSKDSKQPTHAITLYQPTPPTVERFEVRYQPSMQEVMNSYEAPPTANSRYERDRFFRMNNGL